MLHNSYRSLEVQNFFLAQHLFFSHCAMSFSGPQYKTMQCIHFFCNKTCFSPLSLKAFPCHSGLFWHYPSIYHVTFSSCLEGHLWKASCTEDSAMTFEMQRTLLEVGTVSRHCDVFFITNWASLNDRVNSLRIYRNYPCCLSLTLNSEKMN